MTIGLLQGSLKNNKKLSQIECVLPERAARLCRLPKQEPFGAIRQNWLLTCAYGSCLFVAQRRPKDYWIRWLQTS